MRVLKDRKPLTLEMMEEIGTSPRVAKLWEVPTGTGIFAQLSPVDVECITNKTICLRGVNPQGKHEFWFLSLVPEAVSVPN